VIDGGFVIVFQVNFLFVLEVITVIPKKLEVYLDKEHIVGCFR
jgi:hypothetical protein